MDVDEPLTNVAVPSVNSFISDAILADVAVKEPLIPADVNEPPPPPPPPAFKA